MTEIQFAKQFLTTLDSKNTKYQADHVFDPKTFQTRTPYTLPKLSHPPHPLPPKPSTSSTPAPGSLPAATTSQSTSINLALKSSRNPTFTLHIPAIQTSTQILTLKTHIQSILPQVPSEKIKILYNKKPIPPSKPAVGDVLDAPSQPDVEFTVMIIGGAADPTPTVQTIILEGEEEREGPQDGNTATAPETTDTATATLSTQRSHEPVQPGEISGKAVLETAEFWDDLQGFLAQRLKDTNEAARVRALFEGVLKT